MKNFGTVQEDTSFEPKKVYLGKKQFKVVAVNPDEAWMKANNEYIGEKEFERHGIMTPKNDPTAKPRGFARIDLFLKDIADEEAPLLKVSYTLQNKLFFNNAGTKCQVINAYGGTLWVPLAEAKEIGTKGASAISNPKIGESNYITDNVKPAYMGEEELISFIRALRNMNNVNEKTTPEDKAKLPSFFDKEDLEKMFKGNFKDIAAILSAADCTVGFLLGARTNDKGNVYQDIYRRMPLRPYAVKSAKNEYLIKKVSEDQAAGGYKNTFFDLNNFSVREFTAGATPKASSDKDLFDSDPTGFGTAGGAGFGEDAFETPATNQGGDFAQFEEVEDDMPF